MLYNSLYIACYITEQLLQLLYNSYKTVIYDCYIVMLYNSYRLSYNSYTTVIQLLYNYVI